MDTLNTPRNIIFENDDSLENLYSQWRGNIIKCRAPRCTFETWTKCDMARLIYFISGNTKRAVPLYRVFKRRNLLLVVVRYNGTRRTTFGERVGARRPEHKGKWIIEGGAEHVGRISSDNSRQQWEKLIVLKVKQRALNIEGNLNLIWIHQHDW